MTSNESNYKESALDSLDRLRNSLDGFTGLDSELEHLAEQLENLASAIESGEVGELAAQGEPQPVLPDGNGGAPQFVAMSRSQDPNKIGPREKSCWPKSESDFYEADHGNHTQAITCTGRISRCRAEASVLSPGHCQHCGHDAQDASGWPLRSHPS